MPSTFTYGSTNFGIQVPAGRYRARFVGTEDREPFQGESRFGNKDSGPRMAWVFEVLDGEHRGKKIVPETGCQTSPRSKCAAMLRGLVGANLAVGQQVNVESYVGKTYMLKIDVNPDSDKGNLHVADMEPEAGMAAGSTAAATSSRSSGPPSKAPPRNGPAPAATDLRRWWVVVPNSPDDVEPREMSRSDVQKLIDDSKVTPADLAVCLTTESEWKTAAQFDCFGQPEGIPW